MGKYTVIADVGNALVELLQDYLCPDVIPTPEGIGLYAPGDKGDAVLGLHLYDVRESRELRATEMVDMGPGRQRFPGTFLTLSYMITPYSKADAKHRAAEDARIMGMVVQTLADHSYLSAETLTPVPRASGVDLRIQMESPDPTNQQRIWNVPNQPYRTSLFYRVGPVWVESARTRQVQRVVELDITIKE